MSDEIIDLLEPLSPRPERFEEGSAVFHLGDPIRLVHVVRSGLIQLSRNHPNGTRLVLQRAGAGSILAEASVFSDCYHCDAVAVRATETWSVSRQALADRIGSDGTFAQAWTKHLGHKIQQARLQAEIVSLKTVAARLDAWLMSRDSIPPKGEWIGLAAEIGVSPEALYRELSKRRPHARSRG